MLTDEQREVLSGALIPLYQHLEGWVIADVARRIKKTLSYTRTAELEVIALHELGFSPAKIRAEAMKILRADKAFQRQVEENTLEYKREVARILKEINVAAATASEDIVEAAGKMAWEDDLSLWESAGANLKENGALKQIVNAMKCQTREELTNLTRSTGFRTGSGIEAVRDLYQKELDKAVVKMTSGAVTREQCVSDVVKELAHSGIRTVDYASGRSYQLDTAVRMCVNTASGQIAAQVSDSNILNNGITLVRVSEHWGARDKGEGIQNHKEWQGKVYSIDGKAYPEEERRIGMEIRDLEDVTGYNVREGRGALEGLHGVNCRHNHTAWFEGISELPRHDPEPEPKEINGRTYTYYDMTQGMRRREREIRALKRERDALDKLGEDSKDVRAKIRQKTREYEKFCGDCGLRPQPARTRVESGSSDLTKTKAWKEYERKCEESPKSIDHPAKSDTMMDSMKNRETTVHTVAKIDKDIYKCITEDIVTDEVIITDNQMQHILERHPDAYDKALNEIGGALINPDYIIRDKRADTGLVIKRVLVDDRYLQMVLRLCTSNDPKGYKNSIISCWEISEKRLSNYLRNKEILYRKG